MRRIQNIFAEAKQENRSVMINYLMACDPDFNTSLELIKSLPKFGTDIIEIGMAFTDPMAEGETIQRANIRALNSDYSLENLFKIVTEFRKENSKTPIILMGYFNPIFAYGEKEFIEKISKIGADGLIIVDLPIEEMESVDRLCNQNDVSLIRLIAPTTSKERIKNITNNASGFIYYITVKGITGTKTPEIESIKNKIREIREQTNLPIAAGFGIKTKEQAKEIQEFTDGIVIGSSVVKLIEKDKESKENPPKNIESFLKDFL